MAKLPCGNAPSAPPVARRSGLLRRYIRAAPPVPKRCKLENKDPIKATRTAGSTTAAVPEEPEPAPCLAEGWSEAPPSRLAWSPHMPSGVGNHSVHRRSRSPKVQLTLLRGQRVTGPGGSRVSQQYLFSQTPRLRLNAGAQARTAGEFTAGRPAGRCPCSPVRAGSISRR